MTDVNEEYSKFSQEENFYEEESNQEEYEKVTFQYEADKINIVTRELTIELLLGKLDRQELDLVPDFKRHADLWTDAVKSRLIESILIRIPLPVFYIDATNENTWLVIDGSQRLFTLKQFVSDKTLKLIDLEYLHELQGKNYDELERRYQRRILESQVVVYLIERGTPPEFKYNIFKRINTSGTPLSSQELRHALNPGKANQFIAKLADSEEFQQVVNLSESRKKRMEDREFILGFLAFTLTSYKDYQEDSSRDIFLNTTLSKVNEISEEELNQIESNFKKAMLVAFEVFGKNAFRRIAQSKKFLPVNKALFETISVIFSQLSDKEIKKIKDKKEILISQLNSHFINDKDFGISLTQVLKNVKYRFMAIEKLIKEVLL